MNFEERKKKLTARVLCCRLFKIRKRHLLRTRGRGLVKQDVPFLCKNDSYPSEPQLNWLHYICTVHRTRPTVKNNSETWCIRFRYFSSTPPPPPYLSCCLSGSSINHFQKNSKHFLEEMKVLVLVPWRVNSGGSEGADLFGWEERLFPNKKVCGRPFSTLPKILNNQRHEALKI